VEWGDFWWSNILFLLISSSIVALSHFPIVLCQSSKLVFPLTMTMNKQNPNTIVANTRTIRSCGGSRFVREWPLVSSNYLKYSCTYSMPHFFVPIIKGSFSSNYDYDWEKAKYNHWIYNKNIRLANQFLNFSCTHTHNV
jgi:hypothetical protein